MKPPASPIEIYKIALVGNPNVGKTTLHNALTGANHKVGNYAGVTVDKHTNTFLLNNKQVECIDIPGIYSLRAISKDEDIATKSLLEYKSGISKVDLIIFVLDACNLDRNLFLLSQVAELNQPMLVVLTMTDLLPNVNTHLNISQLQQMIGVEVLTIVSHKETDIQKLCIAIERNLTNPQRAQIHLPEKVSGVSDTTRRYRWVAQVTGSVQPKQIKSPTRTITDRIDSILTHRLFGLIIFLLIMLLVFQSIYSFARPLMYIINTSFHFIGEQLSGYLSGYPVIQSLMVDGLVQGVGTVLSFLPQIAILFFFIAVLEGTGYLARAAFLMDKLLGWCGLNGRAFIPLLSSFACAIPGIMSARVIPDERSRLATILVAPLMSCSARLPVYILLIGAIIEPKFGPAWAGITLFAMHLLGFFVAIPIVWVLNKGVFKSPKIPFLFELPSYQWPKWKEVLRAVSSRASDFVKTAGTIIVKLSLLIWALLYFPRSNEQTQSFVEQYQLKTRVERQIISQEHFVKQKQIENSILGRVSKTIEPIFEPAGFDWRLTTAVLAAFPAREVLVSSLGIIFQLGGEADSSSYDLRHALQKAKWPNHEPLLTTATAISMMVFFALCCQCMATLAVVRRETGTWRWPIFMFSYMSVLAYAGAVLVQTIAKQS